MKKTLTVNLGGTVFHIDEDAYNLLDNYLDNLRVHFGREEDAEEIVRDMEMRISELFTDRLKDGKQVITIEDVEEIIARMGRPEDMDESNEEQSERAPHDTPRRLYRDPDNKVLGGVLGGLSAYMNCDPVLLRLLFIALCFPVLATGIYTTHLVIAYIVAWAIIPQARTASEKLAMKGLKVNVENIGRTVTDGFEKVNDYMRSERPRGFLRSLGEGIVSVVGFLVKFFFLLMAICFTPVLLVLMATFIALLLAATGVIAAVPAVLYRLLPLVDWDMVGTTPTATILMAVSGILAIGIPIVGVVHLLMRHFGGWQPMSFAARLVLILLWLASLGTGIYFLMDSVFVTSLVG